MAEAVLECPLVEQTRNPAFDLVSKVKNELRLSSYPIGNIEVKVSDETLVLWGNLTLFFHNQVAQNIALKIIEQGNYSHQLTNNIVVSWT